MDTDNLGSMGSTVGTRVQDAIPISGDFARQEHVPQRNKGTQPCWD